MARRSLLACCAALVQHSHRLAMAQRLERCADTCDESPQAARNGICEERSLGAACDRGHSCRCPPLSDGTDCLALRPCALPSGKPAAGAARQEPTAASPAPMGASPAPAPRTLATAAASTLSTKEDMLLLLCAVLTVVAIVFFVRYRLGMRRLTTAVESLEAALAVTPGAPQPIGMLSVNVVRIKGLTTGRPFRARVRLAVQSERVERTERRSTRLREATYNPSRSGFGVEWHEELLLPCFSADSVLVADVLECTPGEGGEDETQTVLARVSEPVPCGAARASAQGVWHRLVAGSSEFEGQIAEEAELKLKIELRGVTIVDGRVQVASGQAEDFSAKTGVEELADALMQGGARRHALVEATLLHTKAIAMAAQQAAPMAERKPIFIKAESMLGDLSSQPLCVSPFWASEGGLAAASAVAGLIAEVLQTPTDTSERAAVLRAGRFCDTVATGPQLSSMYPMLSGREAESQAQTTANPVVL